METRFVSVLLLLALATVINATSSEPVSRCGFLLSAPKVLLTGVDEELCVTFHDVTGNVSLTVSILKRGATVNSQVEIFRDGRGRCFRYQVPHSLTPGEHKLSVTGSAPGECTLSGESRIHIKTSNTNFVYIQTDKPVYKPGQTVLFRILSLNLDLKPKDVLVSTVIVEDPSGARVMQWSNQTTSRGLLSLTFPLATEPTLGVWKLKVNLLGSDQEQTFKVDEYVLPKFEVVVNMPTYILVNTEQIEGEICARYTYGKPVKGSVKVKLCVRQSYYGSRERPCAMHTAQINGCVKFSILATQIQLSSNRWSIWGATIAAEATVTETATGISLNGSTSHTKVEQNPIFINIKDGSDAYFKPGFPFHGRGTVTRPDGTPAPGEEITVIVNHRDQTTHTSDENGHFLYTLPQKKKDVVKYHIAARAQAYSPSHDRQHIHGMLRMIEPNTYHEVSSWYSPSGSYLQVRLARNSVNCGGQLRANVSYSTAPNTTFKFYYQVMSRGNIVLSGHKSHHFGHGHGHVEDTSDRASHAVRIKRTVMPPFPPSPPEDDEHPEVPELPHIAHFEVVVPVTADMSPTPKLLVYYVREDRETVADSVSFSVAECLSNDVSLRASSAQSLPGQQVTFTLGADAGSLCAVGIVDKSVHLLGGNNKLTKSKIFSSLKDYELDSEHGPYVRDDYCDRYFRDRSRRPPAPPFQPLPQRRGRWRRDIFPGGSHYSEYVDSSSAFKASGMVVVSNLDVATRPCKFRPQIYYSMAVFDEGGMPGLPGPMALPAARNGMVNSPMPDIDTEVEVAYNKKAQETVVDLRTYFPETWLWKLVDIGRTGQHEIQEQLPHTITEWIGSAFCTNTDTGLGISDVMKVKAFQPFFVSFTLPYSVIRREKVPVLVTVFNYLTDCLVVELNLKNERGYRFVGSSRKTRVCVCGSETVSHTYYIIANTIGEVNVTVTAMSVSDEEVCGNDLTTSAGTGARDAVTRPLIVEPEGREDEYSDGAFICPAEGQTDTQNFHLVIPDNVVADSVRGFITVIGDVMGSSLSGLDKLLTMPTGCGEQNMIKFAPNIFVLQYLTHTDQLTSDVDEKARNFMRVGYQRELTYRHDDGSYSAFGKNDDEGSMWLTAFVVRSFAQARPFISIDDKDLEKSIKWFKARQLENGCFPSVGRVLHKDMKGGLAGSRAPAALTAYVLIAMLDAGIDVKDTTVRDAMHCLETQETTQNTSDVYAAALTAYAYTLYARQDPKGGLLRNSAINKLNSMAISSDGTMHWGKQRADRPGTMICGFVRPMSIDVEVTSYALLAYLGNSSTTSIMKSLPIVKWLTKQRNQYGGFASTQDTVLALQALASYASLAYSDGIRMDLSVQGQNINRRFAINQHNKLVLQSEQITIPNNLIVSSTGRGCAMFQANVKFNVPVNNNKSDTSAFDLKVSVSNRGVGTCKKRMMSVCTRYNGPGEASNMAIVAVKMVSGWIPDKESIRKIKQDSKLGIKRIETDQKWVNFYFDELTGKSKCIKFVIEQDMDVQNAKPAYVEVYDYYDKDLIVKEKYRIKKVCGTKNEIPFLTREEFEKAEASGVIEQRRVPPELLFPTETNITMGKEEECPICLNHIPNNFVVKFCAADHAYQTDIKRSSPRVLSDLRPTSRRRVLKSVTVSLPAGCTCSTLSSDKTQKVVILTDADVETTSGGRHSLHLSANNMVIPITSRSFKKQIKKAHRNRRCRV